MKINSTIKIGSVALATLLTALVNSCASHKTGVITPINLPKVQHTLAAPKSLEGAWIKLRSHGASFGTSTDWWYIKNGEAHHYWDDPGSAGEKMENGHPVSPASLDSPERLLRGHKDSLGRYYVLASYTYVPTGATAKLYIKNFDRRDTTICRSVSTEGDSIHSVSEEPAVITFKSENQGVYEGSLEGYLSPGYGWTDWVRYVDSITIFTK